MVGERAAQQAGLDQSGWKACEVENGRVLSCGGERGGFNDEAQYVSAFNPATVDQNVIRFEVDSAGEYEVSLFSEKTHTFEAVASDMLCYNDTTDTPKAEIYTACELYVGAAVPAQQSVYLKVVKKSSDRAETLAPPDPSKSHVISSQETTLGFTGTDADGVA